MAATLKLEIVTPEEKIYSEDVEMVTLPGSEGELGVYPNHVPVLTALKPGELRVIKGWTRNGDGGGRRVCRNQSRRRFGFDRHGARASEKIDVAAAEKAVERAQAAMKEDHTAEEVARDPGVVAKSARAIARKRRPHRG